MPLDMRNRKRGINVDELTDNELEELERLNKGSGDYNFQIDKRNRYEDLMDKIIAEIRRLRAENAELVVALRGTANSCTKQKQKSQTVIAARAILARHDGKGKQ